MEWRVFINDQIEEILGRIEQKESEGQALKLEALEELDRRQVFTADGSRNLSEWYAAGADVSHTTARSLVQTMRRTQNKPHLRQARMRVWSRSIVSKHCPKLRTKPT